MTPVRAGHLLTFVAASQQHIPGHMRFVRMERWTSISAQVEAAKSCTGQGEGVHNVRVAYYIP